MAVTTVDALPDGGPVARRFAVNWALVSCVGSAILMLLSASLASRLAVFDAYASDAQQLLWSHLLFSFALVTPVLFSWRQAIADNQLPAKDGAEPRYEHVSGWNALFLIIVVALIAWLVWWAAGSDEADRQIHEFWGLVVVGGLTVAFILVAAAPLMPRFVRLLGMEKVAAIVGGAINTPVKLVGDALSGIDGFFVFAVANAAGANRRVIYVRYGVLLSLVGACAALGYLWDGPTAFIPIAWGFFVAFAVSRRWSWVEQDRELAMLNSTISRSHIRVGFDQNLRDEALVAFLSMFLLVPLALRQAQLVSVEYGAPLFTLDNGADIDSLRLWVAFYGTELAKAVPFVDWAEVYEVGGNSGVEVTSDWGRHTIFATRVLIDLVFLAALLQAISSASRDAQQKDLFYRKQSIHRLDPFTEPDAFRALVRRGQDGDWERNGDKFEEFPRDYDPNRLVELSAHPDERIRRAADLLLERDGVGHDPHHNLSLAAAQSAPKPEEMRALLDTIENSGPARNIYQLALARRRLLTRRSMLEVRARIVRLIAHYDAPEAERAERVDRLIEALVGEMREPYASNRKLALDALAAEVVRNLRVRTAIEQVAAHDGAQPMKRRAVEILAANPLTPD